MSLVRTPPNRRVITFYSYKGGVGRTMALANIAYRLANTHGLRVIAVDWDLEAPGLHRFFGISADTAARTNGILDYFLAWREAVERDDPEPPSEVRDVMQWILPIEDKDHKPNFGAVSLLLAGRQDRTYDTRLARLNWHEFYAEAAGAVAVERLREQLVERADVVLIDSRTGLTDAGGICTMQLPDGVVLMTAPNEQSLEGIEGVARAIVLARGENRADRERIKLWLSVARVSSNEETDLAQRWFEQHTEWFEKGVEAGLWLKEDHPDGMRSLEIRHAGRWGFGEVVLRPEMGVDVRDPLVVDYERLTETLFRWVRGEPPTLDPLHRHHLAAPENTPKDLLALEEEVKQATKRGDMLGLGLTLVELASGLGQEGRRAEGIRKLEQAIGLFLSRGAHRHRMFALAKLGSMLYGEARLKESADVLTECVALAHELDDREIEAVTLAFLASIRVSQGSYAEAVRLSDRAYAIVSSTEISLIFSVDRGRAHYLVGQEARGIGILRSTIDTARANANVVAERSAIQSLLQLTEGRVPDADALRARLAELEAAKPEAK